MSNFSGAAPAQWWVLVDNQTYGPFDIAAMAEQARQGRINARTTIAAAGSQDWIPAANDPQLAGLFAAPPPRQTGARASPMVPQTRAGAYEPVAAMQYAAPVQAPRMGFGAVLFSFQGRINRARFWGALVVLVLIIIALEAAIFAIFAGPLASSMAGYKPGDRIDPALYPMFGLFALLSLVVLWPAFAIQVKRWHDRDKSGWWILIGLVPIIGGIWAFVEAGCLRGTPGPNRFGPDPLEGRDA